MTAADILRAAADLVEDGTTSSAVEAISLTTNHGPDSVAAMQALAAHLPYPAGQNPERLLRRWSNATSLPDMVREMRAAADNIRSDGSDRG